MKKVGFIGAGMMGSGMIRNLIKAGFDVSVYNRTKEKAMELESDGAVVVDSIADCVENKDVIITIVGYPEDVESVYLSPDGVIKNASANTLLIDMSTSTPVLAERIYTEAKKNKMESIDAPVSGGPMGAANGTLTIMAGGDPESFKRAAPYFDAMGKNITLCGPAGCGQHVKMTSQIAACACLVGVCEAITYARAANIDPKLMIDVISTGAANSKMMELNAERIINGDDSPYFFLKHMLKDINIAVEESEKMNHKLHVATLVRDAYKALADRGMGDNGFQNLIHHYIT